MVATAPEDQSRRWQFWIDRGGTFTDIVARRPDGSLVTHKLLSDNPEQYTDAAVQGIRDLLALERSAPIPAERIDVVKMGTTVATNALLERKGEPTLLVTNAGLGDALRIGYQARPQLFARNIVLPEPLYRQVLEVSGRVDAAGNELVPLDLENAQQGLETAYRSGLRACAVVLMHGYRYPEHERAVAALARRIGFTQVSVSHEVSPMIKLVARGDTTTVDAYLSPVLRRYVDMIAAELGAVRLLFMQSSGGLTEARIFQGKDSILSGPAGGIVGAAKVAQSAGYRKIIGFDMGGTSTDVTHYAGEFERTFDTAVAGVRMRAPMMQIHTVAAGGGSICHFDGARYRVGPDSAGANPGPACYRRDGPLTVTDCNVMLGKLQPRFFPAVFGPEADQRLDEDVVRRKFAALAEEIYATTGDRRSAVEVAQGFLSIAVDNMANAIKQISIQRGYDISEYTLVSFGGAGGQHACLVADALGMTRVLLHPYAGVLSAYGMGLAEIRALRERSVEETLSPAALIDAQRLVDTMLAEAAQELSAQGIGRYHSIVRAHLKYQSTDTPLLVPFGDEEELRAAYDEAYRRQYGFLMEGRPLVVDAVSVELVGTDDTAAAEQPSPAMTAEAASPLAHVDTYMAGAALRTPVYDRDLLQPGQRIDGPAILSERTGTTVLEPGWRAELTELGHLVLERVVPLRRTRAVGTEVDPVMLEIFNNLFRSVAEQMGVALRNTAHSVNIKERLDFSCALFDAEGRLVANAPHVPVHLGSMGSSVRAVIERRRGRMHRGDVFMLNNPYAGGTHLPDITVVTPVFDARDQVVFYVASRGHHSDVGGITPGSMPPTSRRIEDEGVLIDDFHLVADGRLREAAVRELFGAGRYPARNIEQNLSDLRAQIAANESGVRELGKMVQQYGLEVVHAYMQHVRNNAEEQVRRVIDVLSPGEFVQELDNGALIRVKIDIDRAHRCAHIDFSGTSSQLDNNFNAPASIVRAAVLYVFRTLVEDEIPLNDGCLAPLEIHVPEGSMLNPRSPAAVCAGNVETSQAVTNALYGALGVLAAAQGTMNNLTFGDEHYQYYETICGGAGAGPDFDGASAVQTHMTNSRLTDPEVLEQRFPVLLRRFAVRRGSGGAGRYRGGDGVVRELEFLVPMTAALLANNHRIAPFGLAGGAPGQPGRAYVRRRDGNVEALFSTCRIDMASGDSLIIESPGGGGFGERVPTDPSEDR